MPATPSTTYTHGYGDAVIGSHRHRTAQNSAAHLLPHLQHGQRLLDVGSGAGTITADLARIVGPENLVALEVGEEAAALTRAELKSQGLDDVRVVVGDAHELSFDPGSFDVTHAHQVLQHVADPVTVLAQMRRVTRDGGTVSVRDSDYQAFRWYPDVPELDRWRELYLKAAHANGGTPDAGRRLLAWAHQVGFAEVTPSASTQLYATDEGRASWAGTWAGRTTGKPLGEQIVREGWADEAELASIAQAWTDWAEDRDAWFVLLHGEILARP